MKSFPSYAESIGAPVVNWRELLLTTVGPIEHIVGYARSWKTCACGQQDARIERFYEHEPFSRTDGAGFSGLLAEAGTPKDPILRALGSDFYRAVLSGDRLRALDILDVIEARAQYLLVAEREPKGAVTDVKVVHTSDGVQTVAPAAPLEPAPL